MCPNAKPQAILRFKRNDPLTSPQICGPSPPLSPPPRFLVCTGDLATSVGAPLDKLPNGKQFLDDYTAAKYSVTPGAYGAYAYDATRAIIEALKSSLKDAPDAKSARKATIDAVGKVSLDGLTGKVAFDEYGDSTTRVLTVYKVEGGAWVADETSEFGRT